MKHQDSNTTVEQLKKISDAFVQDRDWKNYHSPKEMAIQLSVEANELLAHFLYVENTQSLQKVQEKRETIEDEAADCLLSLLNFCNDAQIDITAAFFSKLKKLEERYPAVKK